MIYVHIPFCRSFCTYCDFYSEVALRCPKAEDALKQEALFERYAEALAAEIKERENEIQGVRTSDSVNTLYLGGGTPSVLPLGVLRRLSDALNEIGLSGGYTEFTIEVNPEDIVEKGADYVERLLQMGVNRVSMGVQSFDDSILKWMNRRHDAATAVRAYQILEDTGVKNISIDLIFGLPQLSDTLWHETLDRALSISSRGGCPQHISSYQLSVEPGSMLAKLVDRGKWTEASEESCQRQYAVLCETLASAGYHHYEISNFAQPGYEAVHNSAYWRHVPYVGLGPGAHSFVGGTFRQWNEDNLNAYLNAAEEQDFSTVSEREILNREQLIMEKVMLSLRTSCGMQEDELRKYCDNSALNKALGRGDLLRQPDGSIRIPESRFFVSDSIISSII